MYKIYTFIHLMGLTISITLILTSSHCTSQLSPSNGPCWLEPRNLPP
uniref:Uncharacterized protein n=1 Tax=Anguilla anguilla TaxID=7936 RepID=A0A0E9S5F5_ANGAN